MSAKVFYEKDADLNLLKDKTICILGYGSQGRAHALNLHDSGLEVVVGLRDKSRTFDQVSQDGLTAAPLDQALAGADVISFLLPDPPQPAIYDKYVAPTLKKGQTLLFAHGFNVHYGQIRPPDFLDVVMIAPKSPGNLVRELYLKGQGAPCLLAVEQDASGQAQALGLAYALGLGCARAGVLETTFKEETETDLFGEQAVLCGGITSLMKAGFETLVEAGYAPEMAYFECINEMKLIVDLVYRGGLGHMRRFVSETAKYGDITRGPRIIDDHVRQSMGRILDEIQDGRFAREWVLENQANRPVYRALLQADENHQAEVTGRQLRSMMKWLG
ncbi:MAG: ketol-acid reductoisomerase [Deltaproteobacteria bacterium]|nr:ketol-acid reductoisomerase [Deltaproteobacteria bacterium]